MKWFFRVLGAILLSVVIALVVVVLLIIDKPNPPVDEYEANEEYTLTLGAERALDTLFIEPETTPFEFDITQGEVNTLIYKELKKSNPDYLVPDVDGSEYFKVISGYAGLGGVWINTKTDGLTLVVRADLIKPMKFKTALRLNFKLDFKDDTDPDKAVLNVKSIKIGKLKITEKFMRKVIPENMQVDMEKSINEALTKNGISIGEFDFDGLTLKLSKQGLIDVFSEGESTVYKTILNLLNANDMLDLTISEAGLKLSLATQKIYNNPEMVRVAEADRFNSQAELDRMLETKSTNMLLSTINSADNEMYINLSEYEINRMLEYFFRTDLESTESEVAIGRKILKLEIMPPNILIDPTDGMKLVLKIKLYEKSDPTSIFYTTLITELTASNVDGHLAFGLGAVAFGSDLSVTEGEMADILSLIDATEVITESGVLKINYFLENFSNTNHMTSTGIKVKDGYIILKYTPSDTETQAVLASVKDKITDAVAESLSGEDVNQEVKDAYNEIKDKDPADITDEEMNQFIDTIYTEMSDDEIDQFKEDIASELSEEELERLIQLRGSGA